MRAIIVKLAVTLLCAGALVGHAETGWAESHSRPSAAQHELRSRLTSCATRRTAVKSKLATTRTALSTTRTELATARTVIEVQGKLSVLLDQLATSSPGIDRGEAR